MDNLAPSSEKPTTATDLWLGLRTEATHVAEREPELMSLMRQVAAHFSLTNALAYRLAHELGDRDFPAVQMEALFQTCHSKNPSLAAAAEADLRAIAARDPASGGKMLAPFLFYKGFHALQAYRVAHNLWQQRRTMLALYIQSRMAAAYAIDIHPAAKIGIGILMDHAHGIVIGETSVIEDNVSLLHNVTLGGTGKESGDRHPKIRSGVMIGAGAKILGNIEIGSCARVAAGSVVLENVPPNVTVAGVPARIVGKAGCSQPAMEMNQMLPAGLSPDDAEI